MPFGRSAARLRHAEPYRTFCMGCCGPSAAELEAERRVQEELQKRKEVAEKRASEARRINERIVAAAAKAQGGANKPRPDRKYSLSGYTTAQLEELRHETGRMNKMLEENQKALEQEEEEVEEAEVEMMAIAAKAKERMTRSTRISRSQVEMPAREAYPNSWRWAYVQVRGIINEMTPTEKTHYFELVLKEKQVALKMQYTMSTAARHARHTRHTRKTGIRSRLFGRKTGMRSSGDRPSSRGYMSEASSGRASSVRQTEPPISVEQKINLALQLLAQSDLPPLIAAVGYMPPEQQDVFHRISRATLHNASNTAQPELQAAAQSVPTGEARESDSRSLFNNSEPLPEQNINLALQLLAHSNLPPLIDAVGRMPPEQQDVFHRISRATLGAAQSVPTTDARKSNSQVAAQSVPTGEASKSDSRSSFIKSEAPPKSLSPIYGHGHVAAAAHTVSSAGGQAGAVRELNAGTSSWRVLA